MSNSNRTGKVYLGFDVSQKSIEIFAAHDKETSRGTVKINNSKEAIKEFLDHFSDPKMVCVVMETGTHSIWMSRYVQELGFEVIVAHARDLQLIYAADRKSDALDAEKLAKLAQFDKRLLHPIEHIDEERQRDLAFLKARDMLVRQRTQIVNAIRGLLRAFGESDKDFTVDNMKKSYQTLGENMREIFAPLIQQLNYLELGIKSYDRIIKKLCKKYKITDVLRQIKGVGPEISLAFVLIVGDPRRFPGGNKACAYFGLVPKQDQSGEVDKQLNITKRGNKLMRRLLLQGAQYIMGCHGEDCDLRDFGMRIASRGGSTAKKKAKVAVARKLITVLLALWTHPEIPYEPKHRANRKKGNKQETAA